MISELRAGVLLFAALVFFILIIGIITLGSIIKPDRWGERAKLAGKTRPCGNNELSITT